MNFTGRNVSIKEIARAIGKSELFVRFAIKNGYFKFATFIEGKNRTSFYCSDKKVYEEIGYYNYNYDKKGGINEN